MKKIVFFALNDFQEEGGGTIRMLGIMNELAKTDCDVTLISNIKDSSRVHANVKHVPLNFLLTHADKRLIQFILGVFGSTLTNKIFKILLSKLKTIFSSVNSESQFIFFEYLDNSIGYWLKQNKIINGYTNDIHGIASTEFDFYAKRASTLRSAAFFRLKKRISERLDRKVFESSDSLIYASFAMQEYFINLYPSLKNKKNYHLPYVLNKMNINPSNPKFVSQIRAEHNIQTGDFIYLFAGAFKETGGIQDLILAFNDVAQKYKQAKLLLVGDGYTFNDCKNVARSLGNSDKISFLGLQPYSYLASYQEIANVIVCPDRQNLFSNLIVHVKYLDSLVSGKIVINGNFKSVQEINEDRKLSLLFTPSDVGNLKLKMQEAIENYDLLNLEYASSKEYTLQNLTYSNFIGNLLS